MQPVGACFAASPVRDNGENESDGLRRRNRLLHRRRRDLAQWRSRDPSDGGGVVIEPPVELPVELTGDEVAADEVVADPQPLRYASTPAAGEHATQPDHGTALATTHIPIKTREPALSFQN